MIEKLRCPDTGLSLRLVSLDEAEQAVGSSLSPRAGGQPAPESVLLREDGAVAYPVVDGLPVLMTPEQLASIAPEPDLRDTRWAEAYDEMTFYNSEALVAIERGIAAQAVEIPALAQNPWPRGWVDAPYDAVSQLEALEFLGHPKGKSVLQVGGKGMHAMLALLGGADEAWLVTPMLAEAQYARALAERLGLDDQFTAVVGIAEQIPIADGIFDSAYLGGCMHHMSLGFAVPELARVLAPGGRLAAVEPWDTFLHRYGTRMIGKREANAHCRPLDDAIYGPMTETFGRDWEIRNHGPFLRYMALARQKLLGRQLTPSAGLRMTEIDDRLPLPKRAGGSAAVLAQRRA